MSFSAASLRAALELHVPAAASGLVVALSGGADSASLLAAAAALGGSFRALPLRAVHVDHGLQPAHAQFREACESLCRHLGVALKIVRISVNALTGESLEAAARDARYAVLEAQLEPHECLVTAHHRRDQAETLLLQALRGAGVKGLSAMPACRSFGAGWHVRPVLDVPQSELTQFGAAVATHCSIDPMNDDLRFDRAYLRRLVWPVILQRWPGADTALSRAAGHMAEAEQLLDAAGTTDLSRLRDGDALFVPGLRALAPARRLNAVRHWLSELGAELPPTARIVEALRQVFEAEADQLPAVVWGEFALRRYRDRLFLTEANPPQLPDELPLGAAVGAQVDLGPKLGSLKLVAQAGGLAAERLPPLLAVRRRGGGETLRPARGAKTQSVQHLCQSLGVLPWMRDALPLVFAGEELIAVADLWADARWCAAVDAPGLGVHWRDAPIIV
jgi:tRNA(Ile)-lysidine synthase